MSASTNRENDENMQSGSNMCIICGEIKPFSEVHPPKDRQSWAALYNAALIRNFERITELGDISDEMLHTVKYHRKCRANFTNVKALKKLKGEDSSSHVSSDSETPCFSKPPEKRLKRVIPDLRQTVYNKKCIFCDKESKYKKGSRSREPLMQVLELGTDKKLREIAIERGDKKIIAVTCRDIVAAEACYHRSCYLAYTRSRPDKMKYFDEYATAEKLAYDKLYNFIRNDVFLNPRVESQNFLLAKLVSYLNDDIGKVTDSTKKNFRYNISKEFGSSLKFVNIDGKVYIVPDNLTYDLILSDYIRIKITLEEHLTAKTNKDPIPEAAKKIKDDLKNIEKPQVWPPSPNELHMNYIDIPSSLINFLQSLIGDLSSRTSTVIWSIAQDIVYAAFKGTILTPKHVLLPMTCKTLTGNVQFISILNRLGHGCSYSKLLEIDTALCMEKINFASDAEIPLPTSIHVSIPTVLAYDNVDRTEETLSGAGTSHRVNGIIIQKTSSTCLPQRSENTIIKGKQRSFSKTIPSVQDYIVVKRKNPPAVTTVELPPECIENVKEAKRKNLLWIFSRLHNEQSQTVCSWTGFNILIRNDMEIEADTVAYLPCINKPATDMSTVHEILKQCIQIKSQLQLENVILVLDQAIFSKAMEIVWCHPQTFQNLFIMMGGFHIICNLLSIIGKLFGDGGLGDIAVEIGCISQGSIQNVLQGKQYNRGIRLHKCIYEALMRIIYRKFIDHLKSNFPEVPPDIANMDILIQKFCDNMCNETFKNATKDSNIIKIMELFENFLDYLRNENGPLSSFWMTYLDMIELLLGLIRSNREGNWLLFISCIQQMIPWCFAMDKINYARYLSVNFAVMSNLAENHPEICKYLKDGAFCVQLGCQNPFSRIPVDQTLEETVNKDTQTPGGTKGFSLKKGAVEKYYITSEYRASALRQLREILHVTSKFSHPDLHAPRIKRDELYVSSAVQLLETEWINPFDTNPSDIINLSTGRSVSLDVQSSLLNVRKKGEEAYETFKKNRLEKGEGFYDPIKKTNLKTFNTTTTSKKSGKNKEVIIKSDRKLFASMILIAENRHLNMLEVFSHPLGPLPWSISNPDGSMKKTIKAALGKHLESLVSPADEIVSPSATIIDGMALIQKLHGENKTFDQLSEVILNQILNTAYYSTRIDVVFDTYKDKSIKSAERRSRGSDSGIIFKNIKGGHRITKWRQLLQSGDSKNKFIKFLADSWQQESKRAKIGNKTLYVAHSEKCVKITDSGFSDVENLVSSQEEADTRMMLHINDAATEFPNVICVSDDTDVLILALYISSDINLESNLYIKRGSSGRIRLINVKKIASVIGCIMISALPGLHAWTGCDTVSAFSGQGKLKALKLLQNNAEFCLLFSRIGSEFTLINSDHKLIQKFTSQLYSRNTKIENINELRYHIFQSRQGQVDSAQLPPCEDCLEQHTKRANYQAAIWKRCLDNFPEIPPPEEHGWKLDEDGILNIRWMTGAPAPEAVLQLLSCSCLKSCQLPSCTCMVNNLKCTSACKLTNCKNTIEQEEETSDLECNESCESEDENDF